MKPADAANAAAEAVRTLDHVTVPADAYQWPADVHAVLYGLLLMVQRLPQALEQAERWLYAANAAGRVGHDKEWDVKDVTQAVHELIGDLERAGRESCDLAWTLEAAVGASSHLTGLTPKAGAR